MKKLLIVLLGLAVAFAAFAGGQVEPTPKAQEAPKAEAKEAKEIKNPDTFIYASYGSIDSLDPAKAYDNASGGIIQNLYDTLIAYDGSATDKFVPVLAEQVPTTENGGISKDGMTYRFKIRKGVKFHSGSTLTPEGVRYSFLRHMITDPDGGPMWLLLQPLLGVQSTRDDEGKIALKFSDIAKTVTVDGDYVVFHLLKPFPPFITILCGYWAGVIDKDFAVKNGDWDGSEATWESFNNPPEGKAKLNMIASGAGPYKLVRIDPASEVVLERFDGYWGKKPALAKAIYKIVEEWSTRKLMLLQGDADDVTVDAMYFEEMEKEPGIKIYKDLKELSVRAINYNMQINATDNPYIYSGKLDGNGIPPDFFRDPDVRWAFTHAWDQKTYIKDIIKGNGVDVATPIVEGLPYFNPDIVKKRPAFDLKKSEEYMKKAFGGQLWAKGFEVDFLYNTGNDVREASMKMLAENIMSLNPKFKVNVRGVEWATYVDLQRQRRMPIYYIGWGADFPDPDNFANPYMYSQGLYGGRCGYNNPEVDKLIEQGAVELDKAKRKQIYYRLQEIWLEDNIGVVQHQQVNRHHMRDWVKGYVFHPMENWFFYSMFRKEY
jgi:peptide/nickel transport system substrate-binding protein